HCDHNPPLTPPRRGADRTRTNADSQRAAGILPALLLSDRSSGRMPAALCSPWKARFRFFECIWTMLLRGEIVARASRPCVSVFTTEQKLTGGTPVPLTNGSWRAPASRGLRMTLGPGGSAIFLMAFLHAVLAQAQPVPKITSISPEWVQRGTNSTV